jgi:hypothetical protein
VAALFCRMTTYAEVGAASLSHFPPRRLRLIVEDEVDGPMPQIAIHCRLVVINPPTRAGFTPRVAPLASEYRRQIRRMRDHPFHSELGVEAAGLRLRSKNE